MIEKNIQILIIDDDEDFCSYVYDLLGSKGFHVFRAPDGKEGIDILKKEDIDIVLTDMVMPEREGIETIMEVKIVHPDIKIIAMSGVVGKETYLELAEGLGADVILAKPFEKHVLFDAIEQLGKK